MNRQAETHPARHDSPARGGILQRKCACGQHAGGECEECKKKKQSLQRRRNHGAEPSEVPPIVHEVLRSSAQPLDAGTREFMEPRFGKDFSHVQVHTGDRAAHSAQAVRALAYTVGKDVVFGSGQYAPETPQGRELLAHELTHVVQQSGASGYEPESLTLGAVNDSAEREADAVVHSMNRDPGFVGPVGTAPPQLQKLPDDTSASSQSAEATLGSLGKPLPYREATGIFQCVQIMGEENAEYCREEVLSGKPVVGAMGRSGPDPAAQAPPSPQKTTAGNPSVEAKVKICEELLKGPTGRRDENKILALLRSSPREERLAIAHKIGRDRLWADFSFRRRRSVEVLTLDLDEFKDLPTWKIEEYQKEEVLPEDKRYLDQLVSLQKISTPLDPDKITKRLPGGGAKLEVNGVEVTIKPDTTDPALSLGGETYMEVDAGQRRFRPDGSLIPPKVSVTIYTAYDPEINPKGGAKYGIGTRPEDQPPGKGQPRKTSIRYHEGSHGRKALEYLEKNPPPKFAEFYDANSPDQGFALYQQAVLEYETALKQKNLEEVDCVGTKMKGCPP